VLWACCWCRSLLLGLLGLGLGLGRGGSSLRGGSRQTAQTGIWGAEYHKFSALSRFPCSRGNVFVRLLRRKIWWFCGGSVCFMPCLWKIDA